MSKILIAAGEASGDTLGASLVREFLQLKPETEFFGLGGDKMAQAGVKLHYHINKLAFLGFWEVVKNIRFIKKVEKEILNQVDMLKPQAAVLIDYPGFNLSLAPKLKKRGVRIFYYISPQIWAWGAKRIKKIKNNVNMMAIIFEFEKEIYEKAGVPVEWVGHPLLDEVKVSITFNEFKRANSLANNNIPIGLFPGSRIQEVQRLLPEMLSALKLIAIGYPDVRGIIGVAPGLDRSVYSEIIEQSGYKAQINNGVNYDLMAHSRLNLVCSGTATLECAIIGNPLIVLYKTSFLTYHIARRLINIPHIGMVNVVAGRKIVPELVQNECHAEKIAEISLQFLNNRQYYELVKEQLSHIKPKLGKPGAAKRAALAAIKVVDN